MLQRRRPDLDKLPLDRSDRPETNPAHRFADLLGDVAKRRDRNAFAQIFDYYAPRIFGYLLRLGLEPAVAEEMTQEVMTAAWHKAGQFDRTKASASTWLFRIARNRRIDLARRATDAPAGNEDDALLLPDPAMAVDVALDATQRDAILRDAMKALPPEQLSLVRLAFFEELSHSDIAARTALPLGTVKSRLRLAFSRLRRAVEDRGVDRL